MPNTPRNLIEVLDIVTARRPSAVAAQPETVSLHYRRVRTAFEDRNIVAVGISEKKTAGKGTGQLSLCFYVIKKKPLRTLNARQVIPPVMAAPSGAAVFTDVKVIGRIRPQKVNKRSSPLQSGYSICHFKGTAGTLGAVVRKGGKLYVLSNSHVLAQAGKAKRGDPILFPSPYDGGKRKTDTAAVLSYFKAFKTGGDFENRVDAALAEISADRLGTINFAIAGAKIPLRTITPERGMKIVKFGRTSGETQGEVQDVHFRVVINYPGVGQVGFLDQVQCTRYTEGGDSGSIVVDKASGRLVGLHFSGSPSASIFSPIQDVIDELDFAFTSR
jgi:hypothetical protein